MSRGMDALARADVLELRGLAEQALQAIPPGTQTELTLARVQLRILGRLLVLTRRNLCLLGGAGDKPDVYGAWTKQGNALWPPSAPPSI